nr:MAG TPA: hypothetical protein [Caudoviricetes sp.]
MNASKPSADTTTCQDANSPTVLGSVRQPLLTI